MSQRVKVNEQEMKKMAEGTTSQKVKDRVREHSNQRVRQEKSQSLRVTVNKQEMKKIKEDRQPESKGQRVKVNEQ